MSSVTVFDKDKFYLGSLCKRGHDWSGTGQSLRNKSKHECLDCRRVQAKEYWALEKANKQPKLRICDMVPQISPELMELLDTSRYFLGNPCYQNHTWNGTSYCLRFRGKRAGACVECRNKYSRSEAYKTSLKKYQASEKGRNQLQRYLESGRRQEVLRKYNVSEKRKAVQAKYRASGKEKINHQKYRKTEKFKLTNRARSLRRYARKKAVHSVKYTPAEGLARYQDFNNQCAYCGATEHLSLDHFLPIAKGGADCIGNLIPACKTCNVRKSDIDPKDWYERQQFYSKERWNKILKVLGKDTNTYLQMPLF